MHEEVRTFGHVQALAEAFDVTPAHLADLHRTLARRADQEDLLDVAYRTVATPVGTLLIAATERGLVRVAYERQGFDAVLHGLASRLSPRVLRAPRRLDAVARELDEYFAGLRRAFDLPLDHALSGGFRALVQRHLPDIAYGRTESYGQVAREVGRPRAARAVGTACATNPLPIVVPCHRVLRGDGTLGGYAGGLDAKRALLALEQRAGRAPAAR